MQLVGGVDVLIQRSTHEKPERPLWLSSTVFNDDKNSPEMVFFEKSTGHTGILNLLEKLIQNKSKK